MFEAADENRTILPIEVPEIDILSAFEGLMYDPGAMPEQVSAQYVYGILDMYRDAGGKEDILAKVIEEHIARKEGWDEEKIKERLSPGPLPWKPRMIPWALYEIVLEEARVALEKEKKAKEEEIPTITPTMFPFLLGVYSLVAHPLVVMQSGYLRIEDLINNVNKYGQKLNTVTKMETIGSPIFDKERRLMAVTFQRNQDRAALEDLESVVRKQGIGERKVQEIVDAICRRDVATTMGALVGGSILRAQRLEEIKITGNPEGEAAITIYYPLHRRGRILTANIGDAVDLMMQRKGSAWRTAYLEDRLSTATTPIYALAAVKAKRTEREQAAIVARAEAVLAGLGDLKNLSHSVAHHVKNAGRMISRVIEQLYFNEEEIFRALRETTTKEEDRFYHAHRGAIKATRVIPLPPEREKHEQAYGERFSAYQAAMSRLNAELTENRQAPIEALRRREFRMMIGEYEDKIVSRSGNIVREAMQRLREERKGDTEVMLFLDHVEEMDKGYERMNMGIQALFERIREIPRIAEGSGYKEIESISLYEIIDEVRKHFETTTVTIRAYAHEGQRVKGNKKLLEETIENCVQNGIDAIKRSINKDGNAIVIWYDEAERIIYEANTGPEVSPAERIGMFKIGEKGGARRDERSEKIGLALAQKYLQTIGCDIECYNGVEVETIREKYRSVLGEYGGKINVIFGIKCK